MTSGVKANTTTLTIMLIEFVDHCTHPIVPQLNDPTVQTCQNPWSFRMKRQPCQHNEITATFNSYIMASSALQQAISDQFNLCGKSQVENTRLCAR